jgi:hypothetical protein
MFHHLAVQQSFINKKGFNGIFPAAVTLFAIPFFEYLLPYGAAYH